MEQWDQIQQRLRHAERPGMQDKTSVHAKYLPSIAVPWPGAIREEPDMRNTKTLIQTLEKHWQLGVPEAFHRLYAAFDQPFISPCEFLPLEDLVEDAHRWSGMLPQFMPFGHDGAEDYYGFYVPPISSQLDYPVLYWDHEYDHYYPIASGFGAFLRWCVIHGRYLAQDSFDEGDPSCRDEDGQRREFARVVGLPQTLVTEPLPRNDRELYERLAQADPQCTQAMAQLGSQWLARGNREKARDFFARATESAPWFADPYYLLAESYRIEENLEAAGARWWQVLLCPIALSTRTANYDLGADHPESEIYEAAITQLLEYPESAPVDLQVDPLGALVLDEDPWEPHARITVARRLAETGDLNGSERELLNALALATDDSDTQTAYDQLTVYYERTHRRREARFCRTDRTR